MADAIIDPTDENVAILSDGGIGYAMRVYPKGAISDPPTVAQLNGPHAVIGYGRFTEANNG